MRRRLDGLYLSALFGCLALTAGLPAQAQSSPFLPAGIYDALIEAVSGDRAFDDVRHLTEFHRTAGSDDFFAATEFIEQRAVAAGLEDVRLIRQAWDGTAYTCLAGEAWVVGPERRKLASYDDFALTFASGSRTTSVEAELVDVGSGTAEADYEGLEVRGKIVLASGSPEAVHNQAVWKRGALGVVSWATNRDHYVDAPDQIAWGRIPFEAKNVEGVEDGTPGTFAVMVSPRVGLELAAELAAQSEDDPMRVSVEIEARVGVAGDGEQAMVEGWIRGREIHDQQIVLVSHIQEEIGSANDDGSGVASMLEVARALTRLIEDGTLERPRRDIRFWWVNELSSQPQYFRENQDEPAQMWVAINQDMVGAKQSWGGRVQYASRNPWSRAHALDTVMEDVLELVRDTNTGLLTFRGTARPPRFQRPVLSIKGSREPFHARMIPFYGFSDHESFLNGPVGVPATALINWPDDWIHSSGDDLDNIDATQLARNAVVVAAVAHYFGRADADDAVVLAGQVAAASSRRLASDTRAAFDLLGSSVFEDPATALRWGREVLARAAAREQQALRSVREVADTPAISGWVDSLSEGISVELARRSADLDRAFEALHDAAADSVSIELSELETEMAGWVPGYPDDLGAFFDGVTDADSGGLHRAMGLETLNFVDGQRTALDIYESVRAEALGTGEWYYGTVSAEQVDGLLRSAVEAGALVEVESPRED